MKLKLLFSIYLFITIISYTESFARQFFDKSKDLLLANFDLKPDEDDVMAAAALACMLKHPDLAGVDYYVVAGAYGIQGGTYITSAVPGFYNSLFGPENQKWTHAHGDWNGSVTRVRDRVKAVLDAGGKVFVAEAGQSDFTYDVLQAVINAGVSASTVNSKVIVVQHSQWNEDQATQWKLNWVKNNTDYNKIADGNSSGNGTPQYNNGNTSWLSQAKSASNPNTDARSYWTQADDICDNWNASWENPTIAGGGVDFSDNVEIWWIFNTGSNADNLSKFWSRYVTNNPGPVTQGPFGGTPRSVPGTIEAEEFDTGGQGVAYNDTDATNNGPNVMRENEGVDIESRDGGINVGWTANGEWLEYTVNATAGTYNLEARVAAITTGKSIVAKLDGVTLGTFNVPNTGNWGTFQTISINNVTVSGGSDKVLRLEFVGGEVNLNWVRFTTTGGTSTTTTLEPIHDAYLQGSANNNNTLIRVEPGNRVGYFMFDLSGINGTITTAQLKMTCSSDAGNGNITVDKGNSSSWTESNLSNANKPSSAGALGSLNGNYSVGTTYTWNLTAGSLSGGGNLSLIVTQSSGNDVAFASKENTATAPQLVITYTSSGNARKAGSKLPIASFETKPAVLYPNPLFQGDLTLDLKRYNNRVDITVFDTRGRKIYETVTDAKALQLNASVFPARGLYVFNIRSGGDTYRHKLIVR